MILQVPSEESTPIGPHFASNNGASPIGPHSASNNGALPITECHSEVKAPGEKWQVSKEALVALLYSPHDGVWCKRLWAFLTLTEF